MKNKILEHALINAVEYEGKAQMQAVIGKLIAEDPKIKSKLGEIVPEIKKIVKEVNSWPLSKQQKKLKELGIVLEKKKVEEKVELPKLPKAELGKIVMRLAPYPSGPLHIGNARMILLNDEYAKKYEGKLILVFDDTIGSEEKPILPEGYDLIKEGLDWLGVNCHDVLYKSDRIEIFYKYAEEMIRKQLAYVCTCSEKILRGNRKKGIPCECRSSTAEENLKKWEQMLLGEFREGQAVVRLKTDMTHKNPAFRDRVLLRIAEREHPRVGRKYHVWPMLEFSWAIDDHELGITHVLRGKDLVMEDVMEEFIWQKLGWGKPEFIHYGLLSIKEAKLSKTESRRAIERKEYTGWDDPRTWSLQSLHRRGIQPQAVRQFIVEMGLSLADVTVPAEKLYAVNRKIIDPVSNRYFAVFEPVEISVKKAPKLTETEAPLHPDFPNRGRRTIPVNVKKIFAEKNDLKGYKGKEVRLMDLFNIKLKKQPEATSKKIKKNIKKIHWVSEPNVALKLVMHDGTVKEGIGEPEMANVKAGSTIQLTRMGFARVEKVNKDIVLYYAHK